MKKWLSPLFIAGIGLASFAILNTLFDYQALANDEGWVVIAMISLLAIGIVTIAIALILKYTIRKRKLRFIVEVLIIVGALAFAWFRSRA